MENNSINGSPLIAVKIRVHSSLQRMRNDKNMILSIECNRGLIYRSYN